MVKKTPEDTRLVDQTVEIEDIRSKLTDLTVENDGLKKDLESLKAEYGWAIETYDQLVDGMFDTLFKYCGTLKKSYFRMVLQDRIKRETEERAAKEGPIMKRGNVKK
jgi:hypothetical protein